LVSAIQTIKGRLIWAAFFLSKKIKKYNNYIALDVHKMFAPWDEMCMVVFRRAKNFTLLR